jgi:hypothetical protein
MDVIEGESAQPVTRRIPLVKMAINTSGTLFRIRLPSILGTPAPFEMCLNVILCPSACIVILENLLEIVTGHMNDFGVELQFNQS